MEERLGDLEAEHDYLIEADPALHKPSSHNQQDWEENCKLRPDPGPCRGRLPRFYFLARTGACIQFPWGGCGGNANNFLSLSECEATCSKQAIEVKPDQAVKKALPIVQVTHFSSKTSR